MPVSVAPHQAVPLFTQSPTGPGFTVKDDMVGVLPASGASGPTTTKKALSAVSALSGAITRLVSHVMPAVTLALVGSAARATSRALSATLSLVGALSPSHLFKQALTATLSFVGSLSPSKLAKLALTATISFAGASAKASAKVASATLTFATASAHSVGKVIGGTLALAGAAARRVSHTLSGALGLAGAAAKAARRALLASTALAGALAQSRLFKATISGVLALAGAVDPLFQRLTRQLFMVLVATVGMSGSARRSTSRALSGALSYATFLVLLLPLSFERGMRAVRGWHFYLRSTNGRVSRRGIAWKARALRTAREAPRPSTWSPAKRPALWAAVRRLGTWLAGQRTPHE